MIFSVEIFLKNTMIGHLLLYILYNLHVLAEIYKNDITNAGIRYRKKFIKTVISLYRIDIGTNNC